MTIFYVIIIVLILLLRKRLLQIEHKLNKLSSTHEKEPSTSEVLKSMIGHPCKIQPNWGLEIYAKEILDVDDEWVKYIVITKRGPQTRATKLSSIWDISYYK